MLYLSLAMLRDLFSNIISKLSQKLKISNFILKTFPSKIVESERSRAHNGPSVGRTHYTLTATIAGLRLKNTLFDIEMPSLLDKLAESDDISVGQERREITT